ncbi:potassium/proton antiporter [Novilysobacter defluvii]|uniref:Potassium transporter TrkA n=1 Tax=Lysobacter defluvii IMMIB APB-9 = DSM 18482 TaxID=1385515 RepID=A0A0A0M9B4_9GAMM|nr:potassium/proton antiporter [Lysobacter defluvii]KGO99638.1 potassium transporter TrkA [Lysobacter defluvii IMMIB APB-9 = DSM 18482]
MFVIDQLLLLAAVLILLGVVSSRASARLGLPVLVLFLIVGMLAGERGIGGIPFDSPATAHALGTMALALILFDGGLQTPLAAIRSVWKPATALATVGVLVTAIVTGVAAAWILDWPLLGGLMIGAIVGSTDAAAVFAQLRNAGIHLRKRLKSVLEVESASNDPMAIFLTIGLIEVLANEVPLGFGLVKLFLMQMGVGALVGVGVGRGTVALLKRIRLQASGMYPVLVTACGLLAFGLAANLGGSGFLAIFIAGTLVGNSHFAFKRMVILFHDGLAWLAQITMFVVLGLLIDPLALTAVWVEGLLIALALMLVARPLAVWPLLPLFGFNARETALVSWVGLRGSVPIVLAIFPLLFELPGAAVIFNVVFFVVLISAIVQGSTIAFAARRLGLAEGQPPRPAATLEITSLGDVNADIVEYTLSPDSRAVGRRLSRMALPEDTVIAMITRGEEVIPPRGSTPLHANDHLFAVLRPVTRPFVDRAFSQAADTAEPLPQVEIRLKGGTTVEDVRNSYGVNLPGGDHDTLERLVRRHLDEADPEVGTTVALDGTRLQVCAMDGTRVTAVGMLAAEAEAPLADAGLEPGSAT